MSNREQKDNVPTVQKRVDQRSQQSEDVSGHNSNYAAHVFLNARYVDHQRQLMNQISFSQGDDRTLDELDAFPRLYDNQMALRISPSVPRQFISSGSVNEKQHAEALARSVQASIDAFQRRQQGLAKMMEFRPEKQDARTKRSQEASAESDRRQ